MDKDVALIGYASGWGAIRRQTQQGPAALQAYGLAERLQSFGIGADWFDIIRPQHSADPCIPVNDKRVCEQVVQVNQALYQCVCACLDKSLFPVVLGGDHASAIGMWSAVMESLPPEESLGLIWLDAHMDSHTFDTTPSSSIHGMPLASLLGFGEPTLRQWGKLDPARVVLMGVRSYESGEARLLEALKVRVIMMDDIKHRGFQTVWKEALQIASANDQPFGISLDLDGFDPTIASGVGTPEPDGLMPSEVLPGLKHLRQNTNLQGIEVAEYNPIRDHDNQTADLTFQVIRSILEKYDVS